MTALLAGLTPTVPQGTGSSLVAATSPPPPPPLHLARTALHAVVHRVHRAEDMHINYPIGQVIRSWEELCGCSISRVIMAQEHTLSHLLFDRWSPS